MSIELRVPQIGESITEVQIGPWMKQAGEAARKDDVLVEIESDKATVELPAPSDGNVSEILKQQGETVNVGEIIGYFEAADVAEPSGDPGPEPVAAGAKPSAVEAKTSAPRTSRSAADGATRVMPAAERVLAEHGLRPGDVEATGPGGRLLKEDVLNHVHRAANRNAADGAPTAAAGSLAERQEDVAPMSPLRKRIAQRLIEAQQTAALLTTFNEVDMSSVMALRKLHRDAFQEKHNVKLGFMSFFVKATIEALKTVPQLNAEIRDDTIVYRNYYDIGVAVSGRKGLVVPVLRGAERMSFAEVEANIADFGRRAGENKIKLDELQGGTFTISNGGVFGSLLSTPIVNPPQSGILGMHAIQQRPVAIDGQVVIRPMMYVALTYDHRLVDGREAVTFLVTIKHLIEQPARMLLEI